MADHVRASSASFSTSSHIASFHYTDAYLSVDPTGREFFNTLLGSPDFCQPARSCKRLMSSRSCVEAQSLRVVTLRAFACEIASVRGPRCRPRVARVRNLDDAALHEGTRLSRYADALPSKSRVHAARLPCPSMPLRSREPPSPRAMLFSAPARRTRLHLKVAAQQVTHLMFPRPKAAASFAEVQRNCMARRRSARR